MEAEIRQCQKCRTEFTVHVDDLSFYKKMNVPPPVVCPDCRFRMRALFRNETTLYSGRKCDLCSKSIVTMYNPKSPYTVYCYDCFYSDKWNPRDYAMVYDTSRSFIGQMKDFLVNVPKINTYCTSGDGPNINSEYVNMASGCKNCYLIFNTSVAEELLYSRGIRDGRDSSDIYFGTSFDRCYESINVQQSSGVMWGQNVVSCVDCIYIRNGSGLTNCFGCVNLRNKSNCWFNEQLTAEEYKSRLEEILGSHSQMALMRQKFEECSLGFPLKENNNLKTVDSTGDYLFECKNVQDSFEVTKSEDCRYIFSSKSIKDSIGTIGYGTQCERLLECVATGHSSNIIGTYGAENSQNILYGFYIKHCTDCIGCDALTNGKYAIFNKEYSKEEYEILQAIIIKELTSQDLYGLMIPPALAPFAYNETVAQDNFPLTKQEVEGLGFRWENDIQITKEKETILSDAIPDHITEVSDSIVHEVLRCISCERNYKIIPQELSLYRKLRLPIPRICFYCRHQDRILRRGPYKFYNRPCANCTNNMVTNYATERVEKVYCESCYQREVI